MCERLWTLPNAICASLNFDLFIILPRPTDRITHAAKLAAVGPDAALRQVNSLAGAHLSKRHSIYKGDLDAFRAMAKILSLNRFPTSHPPDMRCHVADGFLGKPP
jgi:hypothetical protein